MDPHSFWVGYLAAVLSNIAFGGIVVAFLVEQKVFKRWKRHIHQIVRGVEFTNCTECEDVVHVA